MIQFPPTDNALADPNGLLAVGGDLEPETLITAYRQGIFPWFDDEQPILWWTPTPRAVLFPARLHLSRSLRKAVRKSDWSLRVDVDFEGVIDACAAPRADQAGTWITAEMREAYLKLHAMGVAHSLEVLEGETLVGGLYGLRIGRAFFGESMFSRRDNASKMALLALVSLAEDGVLSLIDCQMDTAHLASLGATTVSRSVFEIHLREAITDEDFASALAGISPVALDAQLDKVLPEKIKDLL